PFSVRVCCGVGSAALGLSALGLAASPRAGAVLGASAALALVGALALGLRDLPTFAAESGLTRCPEALSPLARVSGRVVTPPMAALWGWVLRDGSFDAGMLARQREALLGYTNLTCGVANLRTAAPLPTAAAAMIAASIGPAEDALPAGAAGARLLWTPFAPARLPSRKVGDFFRAPLAPYRPRLSYLRGYAVEPNAERAWRRIASGTVDLTRDVLLDRRPIPDPGPGEDHPMLLARLAEDAPERVVADVTATYAGLLVLTDLDYPGWIAEEDGRRLPMLRADGFFRAVALPPGTHRVVFRYRPLAFYAGLALSALALLVALGLWASGEPARRRGPA
ncbi:MAG TPA: YfhO family protein, partial [Thermoanaerobaculia bacterium]